MEVNVPMKKRSRSWQRVLARGGAAAFLALAASLSSAKQADGVAEALNNLNATVNALIATVNQLNTRVTQLVAAVPAPQTALTTPALVFRSSDVVDCRVVNVGTTPARVTMTLLNLSGAVVDTITYINIQPGASVALRVTSGVGSGHCRFVPDVPVSQIRGVLEVSTLSFEPIVAVEAR
jgi:hypothetical protein